jgi:N-acetylmuramoyl-L-alanine amidase
VIDASHGGTESGADLGDQLLEKDVTLAVARDIRQELAARHLTALLLRENDAAITTDQRASLTNAAHPAIYICIHASSQGTGIRIFTSLIQSTPNNAGPFLDWDGAQKSFLPSSQKAASNLISTLQSLKIPVRSLSAPLRPLNSITAPALAIEIAPPSDKSSQLGSPIYQEAIANMVAIGLAAEHDDLEAGR